MLFSLRKTRLNVASTIIFAAIIVNHPTASSLIVNPSWILQASYLRGFSNTFVSKRISDHMNKCSTLLSANFCSISDSFDGGNIEHLRTEGTTVYLNIKSDPVGELEQTKHRQYFSFRSTVAPAAATASNITFVIENAKDCSFPTAWPGTTVFVSSDFQTWKRVLTTIYKDGQLIWSFDYSIANSNVVYFCYFPPYSYERHLNLLSKCSMADATVKSLGHTLEGREIDCITIGTGPRIAWIIARQHPGETMAEYFAEGLLLRLLERSDAARELFTFHIVPNMCPDGSVRGHIRTNSCGANLNREWCSTGNYTAPTLERSPEVYHVLNEMIQTGVDVFVDVHGDEELPFNFIVGNQGLLSWDDRLEALHGAFLGAYCRANSDMQKQIAYPPPPKASGRANLSLASKQIGQRFGCLAVTLEMPFKDCLTNPDPIRGWTPERSSKLGSSLVDALTYVQPYLRANGVDANTFPLKDDDYVHPTCKYER